jgi:hypothetical protein
MTGDLATVIDATRVGAFVGRSTEVATFRSALAGHDSLRVLFIHGPGGIGKTTLLHQFGIRARNAGRTVVALDGCDVDCSPQGSWTRSTARATRRELRTPSCCWSTVTTGCSRWTPGSGRPSSPCGHRTAWSCWSAREPPAATWRTDLGWRALAGVRRLGPLDEAESVDLVGLSSALLLARDGHEVTILERDCASPPDLPTVAWDGWQRPGVSQFRQAQFLLPRWHAEMRLELPDVLDELAAAGGYRTNSVGMLPLELTGGVRADDGRFDIITARRPVVEASWRRWWPGPPASGCCAGSASPD